MITVAGGRSAEAALVDKILLSPARTVDEAGVIISGGRCRLHAAGIFAIRRGAVPRCRGSAGSAVGKSNGSSGAGAVEGGSERHASARSRFGATHHAAGCWFFGTTGMPHPACNDDKMLTPELSVISGAEVCCCWRDAQQFFEEWLDERAQCRTSPRKAVLRSKPITCWATPAAGIPPARLSTAVGEIPDANVDGDGDDRPAAA